MIELNRAFLDRALESLRGARIEYEGGLYNNSANRSYYACFQAAIFALQMEGIRPVRGNWEHDFVQSQFNGQLINRRHRYPADMRSTLWDNYQQRVRGDYSDRPVVQVVALRALQRAERFVEAVVQRHGERP